MTVCLTGVPAPRSRRVSDRGSTQPPGAPERRQRQRARLKERFAGNRNGVPNASANRVGDDARAKRPRTRGADSRCVRLLRRE